MHSANTSLGGILPKGLLIYIPLILGMISPAQSQSIGGEWKGFLFDKSAKSKLTISFSKNPKNNVSGVENGVCYAAMHFSSTYSPETQKVNIHEDRYIRASDALKGCGRVQFPRKKLEGYVFAGGDGSYLIFQGKWTAGEKSGVFYLSQKISIQKSKAFARAQAAVSIPPGGRLLRHRAQNPSSWQRASEKGSIKVSEKGLMVSSGDKPATYFHLLQPQALRSFLLTTDFRIAAFPQEAAFLWDIGKTGPNRRQRFVRIRNTSLEIGYQLENAEPEITYSADLMHLMTMGEFNQLAIMKVWNGASYFINGVKVYEDNETLSLWTAPGIGLTAFPGTSCNLTHLEVTDLEALEPRFEIAQFSFVSDQAPRSIPNATIPGRLSFTITNTGALATPPLQIALSAPNQADDIEIENPVLSTDHLQEGTQEQYAIETLPTHLLEKDHLEFQVAVLAGADTLFTTRKTFEALPFFHNSHLQATADWNTRQKSVYAIMGIQEPPNPQKIRELQPTDMWDRAWAAYFQFNGNPSSQINRGLAKDMLGPLVSTLTQEARKGSSEATFLLSIASAVGATTTYLNPEFGEMLLAASAEAGFAPAIVHQGETSYRNANYYAAIPQLEEAVQAGSWTAGIKLGHIYADGLANGRKSFAPAEKAFLGAAAHGLPQACLALASLYRRNDVGVEPDMAKSHHWLTEARKWGAAEEAIAASTRESTVDLERIETVDPWVESYIEAAKKGGENAMLFVGVQFLSGTGNFPQNIARSLFWLEKAAVKGNPMAMVLLNKLYLEGDLVPTDRIRSQFWLGQAIETGIVEEITSSGKSFAELLLENVTLIEVNEGVYEDTHDPFSVRDRVKVGERLSVPGTILVTGIVTGFKAAFAQEEYRESRKQSNLNGARQIGVEDGIYTFGAVVSSDCITPIRVQKGEKVSLTSVGEINFYHYHNTQNYDLTYSFGSGKRSEKHPRTRNKYNADGEPNVKNSLLRSLEHIPHGGLIYRIGNGPWEFAGSKQIFVADRDGKLELAINDARWENNFGHYYVTIKLMP